MPVPYLQPPSNVGFCINAKSADVSIGFGLIIDPPPNDLPCEPIILFCVLPKSSEDEDVVVGGSGGSGGGL